MQRVIFSEEEGTLWWHAHSDWTRATVHGAIQIYPKHGSNYPFPKPYKDVPIILGTCTYIYDSIVNHTEKLPFLVLNGTLVIFLEQLLSNIWCN